MISFWQVFGAVFIVFRIASINCDQRFLAYTNLSCEQDYEIVNYTAIVEDGAINVDIIINKELNSIIIDVEFYVKTADSATFTQFSKSTTDVCEFLANPGSNFFLSVMLEHIRRDKRNRISRRCPVTKVRVVNLTYCKNPEFYYFLLIK